MVPDYWFAAGTKLPEWLNPLTEKYLTAEGHWKPKPD
jgi:hypothetical protein